VWTAVVFAVFAVVAVPDSFPGGPGFDGLLVAGAVVASATLSTRRTLVLAFAAVVAAIVIGGAHSRLVMVSGAVRVVGVAAVGAFCVLASHWRERREGVLQRVTRVAEVAQLAILRPIPSRVGSMAFATRYISAADQAFIGGDLYEVIPSATGVRVVVGDVRGKGLEAVRLAALVLGSFREAANVENALADVARAIDRAVLGDISIEDFVTAIFVEFRPGGGRGGRLRAPSSAVGVAKAIEYSPHPRPARRSACRRPSPPKLTTSGRGTACCSTPMGWWRLAARTGRSSRWHPTPCPRYAGAVSKAPSRGW